MSLYRDRYCIGKFTPFDLASSYKARHVKTGVVYMVIGTWPETGYVRCFVEYIRDKTTIKPKVSIRRCVMSPYVLERI